MSHNCVCYRFSCGFLALLLAVFFTELDASRYGKLLWNYSVLYLTLNFGQLLLIVTAPLLFYKTSCEPGAVQYF